MLLCGQKLTAPHSIYFASIEMFYVVCTMLYTSRFLRTCFAEKQLVEPLTKAGSIRDRHNGADGFFVLFPKNSREIPRVSHKNGEDHHNSVWHLHNNALLAGEEGAI